MLSSEMNNNEAVSFITKRRIQGMKNDIPAMSGFKKNGQMTVRRNRPKDPMALTNCGAAIFNPLTQKHVTDKSYYRIKKDNGIDLSLLRVNNKISGWNGTLSEAEFMKLPEVEAYFDTSTSTEIIPEFPLNNQTTKEQVSLDDILEETRTAIVPKDVEESWKKEEQMFQAQDSDAFVQNFIKIVNENQNLINEKELTKKKLKGVQVKLGMLAESIIRMREGICEVDKFMHRIAVELKCDKVIDQIQDAEYRKLMGEDEIPF